MDKRITALFIAVLMIFSLCACGKTAKEDPESSEEEKLEEVQSVTEEEVEGEGTYHYENMYFSMDLPADWEDQVEITEERSSEYYRVYFSDKDSQTMIFGIDLSGRETEYGEYQDEYFGALTVDSDQGHLNIRILYPEGLDDDTVAEIREILETMEASGDYTIRSDKMGVTGSE